MLALGGGGLLLMLLPVDKEVRERLGFDRMARLVRDVVDAELDCPLGDPPGHVPI